MNVKEYIMSYIACLTECQRVAIYSVYCVYRLYSVYIYAQYTYYQYLKNSNLKCMCIVNISE